MINGIRGAGLRRGPDDDEPGPWSFWNDEHTDGVMLGAYVGVCRNIGLLFYGSFLGVDKRYPVQRIR